MNENEAEKPKERDPKKIYMDIEQVEVPIEDEAQKEKKENAALRNLADGYFGEARKNLSNKKDATDDDRLYEGFLKEQEDKIKGLTFASKENNEVTQWSEASSALSELLNAMASTRRTFLYSTTHEGLDEKTKQELLKNYEDAKTMFMTACSKLLPDEKIDLNVSTLVTEVERLKKLNPAQFGTTPKLSIAEIRGMLGEKTPRKVLEMIDNIEHDAGNEVRATAFEGYQKKIDGEDFAETIKGVPNSVLSLYRLELMRNELSKKVYGAGNTLKDEKRIDNLRASM